MKLGVIANPESKSFDTAKELGLSFLEFDCNCLWGSPFDTLNNDLRNNGHAMLENAERWKLDIARTGVKVGALGRWASQVIDDNGKTIESEFSQVKALIDLTHELDTGNYLVSVNYNENLTLYQNISAAIRYLNDVVAYASKYGTTVSIVNCMMGGNYIRQPELWKLVLPDVPGLKIKYDPSHSFVHGGVNGAYIEESLGWGDQFGYVHIKGVVQGHAFSEAQNWSMMPYLRNEELRPEIVKKMEENNRWYDNPPAGLDVINWPAFFAILYKNQYDGLLSIEPHSRTWSGSLGDIGLKYTINYIKNLMW